MQLRRCPRGGHAHHPSLRSTLGAGWLRTTQFSILAKLKRLGPLTINTLARASIAAMSSGEIGTFTSFERWVRAMCIHGLPSPAV
jgi:hypothetical protein